MKFSIVTPAFNSERFIPETIESVIFQEGDFEIEHIIADGGSTDNTVGIIKGYERLIKEKDHRIKCRKLDFKWFSEKDRGMYDAINKGFEKATGDIYAWINSNDIYLPGAFSIIQRTFEKFPEVKWLKGVTSFINEDSAIVEPGRCRLYNRDWLKKGVYGSGTYWVEQDSVFWRAEVWKNAGSIDPKLKLAGDYYLWRRFAESAQMHSLNARVSCFRRHEGQLSRKLSAYIDECDRMLSASDKACREKARNYFKRERKLPVVLRPLAYRLAFGSQDLRFFELQDGEPLLKRRRYYLV